MVWLESEFGLDMEVGPKAVKLPSENLSRQKQKESQTFEIYVKIKKVSFCEGYLARTSSRGLRGVCSGIDFSKPNRKACCG